MVNHPATLCGPTPQAESRAERAHTRRRQDRHRGRGYSLVELIVTLALAGAIGFVAAISVRNILGQNQDRQAISNAQQVAVAQQEFLTRYGSYTGLPSDLGPLTDITVVTGESQNRDEVSIALGATGTAGIAARQNASRCVLLRLNDPSRGGGITEVSSTSTTVCSGASALPPGEAQADRGTPSTKAW